MQFYTISNGYGMTAYEKNVLESTHILGLALYQRQDALGVDPAKQIRDTPRYCQLGDPHKYTKVALPR